jgi:cell division protein FtsQ
MDRSFAGRLGIGSLTRPASRTAKRPKRRSSAARTQARGATPLDRAIEQLWRAATAATAQLARGTSFVWARRRLRIAALAVALAIPLLAGGWLWLRNSSFVSVEHVRVSGVHGSDAHAIEAALASAARQMSTLDVHEGKLRAAVASYPVVGALQVHTSFPHGISIRVVEQPPVAILSAGGISTAVAASGVVLGTARSSEALPTLTSAVQLTPGQRVREPALVADLAVLGAAPARLAKQVERAYNGPKGLTLVMHGGLLAYFGDASRPHAKWISLARVLADSSSAGASYIDVRSPERPAAGFPGGVAPASAAGSEAEGSSATPSASESSESLAEGLKSATGVAEPQSGTSTEAAQGEASGGEAESESPSSETSGASSEANGEASGLGEAEAHE